MWDITAIGDIAVDLIMADLASPVLPGRETTVADARLALGGATAIFAAAAARLGLRVRLVGAVGDDTFGRFALGELEGAGVDTALVRTERGATTAVTVSLSGPADRALITHLGTIATFGAADIPDTAWDETRHLHVSSFFLQHALRPDCAAQFQRARARGIATSLDTGDDPADCWDSGIREALAAVDLLFPNEREATRLCGTPDPDAALALLAARVPEVAMKRGGAGAVAIVAGQRWETPAFAVQSVDTTGAGDVFDAGYLWGRLDGRPPHECLRRGAAAGALATTWLGGQGERLTARAVDELMASCEGQKGAAIGRQG